MKRLPPDPEIDRLIYPLLLHQRTQHRTGMAALRPWAPGWTATLLDR